MVCFLGVFWCVFFLFLRPPPAYWTLRSGSRGEITIEAAILLQSMCPAVCCGNLPSSTMAWNHFPIIFFPACFFQHYTYNPPIPNATHPISASILAMGSITKQMEVKCSHESIFPCRSYCSCSGFKTPECKPKVSKILMGKTLTEKGIFREGTESNGHAIERDQQMCCLSALDEKSMW